MCAKQTLALVGDSSKDPIEAMEWCGKFLNLALNTPRHVHKHSITNVVVFQSCSLIIILLLLLLRLTDILSSQLPGF